MRNFSGKGNFPRGVCPGGYLTIVRIRNACVIAASINSRTPRNFLRVIAVIYNAIDNEMRERLSSENGGAMRCNASRIGTDRKEPEEKDKKEEEEGVRRGILSWKMCSIIIQNATRSLYHRASE